jgi:hypothetical protein
LPRSMTLLSHVRLLWAMQLSREPPVKSRQYHIPATTCRARGLERNEKRKRTVVAAGDAAAGLAVGGGAGVLLQVGVGHAAGAAGDRAALVLAGHEGAVLGKGGGNGSQAEDEGGEGELHPGGWVGLSRRGLKDYGLLKRPAGGQEEEKK